MAKKRKKYPKPEDVRYDFHRLDQAAVNYIDTKVRALGSIEAVARDYNAKDLVSEFARMLARGYFKEV